MDGAKGKKQPWHFRRRDDAPFAFAGLWECWRAPGGGPVETCTIVTTEANELAAKYHDRMPVILHPVDYARWLDPENQRVEDLTPLLAPYPAEPMVVESASTLVNNPRNESSDCLRVTAPG